MVVVALVALLGAACKTDATVEVRVREDGSGVVVLTVVADAEAVRAVESGGAQIDQAVRLTDLEDAGFRVEPWVRAEDGSASLVLRQPFENVSEVASIVADISGDDGPLRDVRATRERSLFATEYALRGGADLESVATGVPADQALVESLAAQGVDVSVIDQQLLAQVRSSFTLEVVARLPGGAPVRITAEPGAVTTLDAVSSVRDTARLALLIAAAVLLLLAVVLWVRGGRRRRRRRGRRPPRPRRPSAPTGAAPPRPAGRPRPGPAPRRGSRAPTLPGPRPAPSRRPAPPGPRAPGGPPRPPPARRRPPPAPPAPPGPRS